MNYTLSDFDYHLPHEQIATQPANPREAARLLRWPHDGNNGYTFADLPKFLNSGDLLVLNNTRVIPARLIASRPREQQEGVVHFEVLLHKPVNGINTWEAFVRPAKRMKEGMEVDFPNDVKAVVKSRTGDRVVLEFQLPEDKIFDYFEEVGDMPLPPYIDREDGSTDADKDDYQTVYAEHKGSVAAPTAGLHFSEELLQELQDKGVNIAYVTLHVGAGTFQPVRTEDLDEHDMHSEWGQVSADVVEQIKNTQAAGGNVVAVGTTSLRTLESAAKYNNGEIAEWTGETNLFCRPGYAFKVVDKLITNFHLPKSTLIMLVSAFVGYDETKEMYEHAIKEGYKFYSYGDGSILTRKK